jgi:pimeloyl-ACP methyl ester carboxylesterase
MADVRRLFHVAVARPRRENFLRLHGDTAKPAILMLHGFPTSSFDYHLLIEKLQPDFRICTFDFPGYGLSDKPAVA